MTLVTPDVTYQFFVTIVCVITCMFTIDRQIAYCDNISGLLQDLDHGTKREREMAHFGTNLRFLFHLLHFRCLHLESHQSQQKCPMVKINTLSVNRETWNVFYNWTFVFICRIHICIYYIYFVKATYKQYHQMKFFFVK